MSAEKPKRIQRALSIRQPWAHAILHLGKDIENRNWRTNYRGTIAVHAAKGMTQDEAVEGYRFMRFEVGLDVERFPNFNHIPRAAIVGLVDIVDCVTESVSPWFQGDYGFVLENPRPLVKPIHCKGALGLWNVPPEIEKQILDQLDNTSV